MAARIRRITTPGHGAELSRTVSRGAVSGEWVREVSWHVASAGPLWTVEAAADVVAELAGLDAGGGDRGRGGDDSRRPSQPEWVRSPSARHRR